jgi:hypothetical protein
MKAFNQLGGRIKNSNFDFKDEIQSSNWGRRYDHKFRRFLPIFGEKIGVFFSKTKVKILQKLVVVSVKNANVFAKFLGGNIYKIITLVPSGEKLNKLINIGK